MEVPMNILKKYKNRILIIIFLIFTFYAIANIIQSQNEPEEVEEEIKEIPKKETPKKEDKVIIDIKGEIVNPGVYELKSTNTVMDAINQAGGLTKISDTSNLNLSKKIEDEMVIIVYSKVEIQKMKQNNAVPTCPPINNACLKSEDEKAKLENKTENKNSQININTATKEELQTLDGVGETKAESIIDYRNKNGNFQKIEDIKNVSGIGDSSFEKIKDRLTI